MILFLTSLLSYADDLLQGSQESPGEMSILFYVEQISNKLVWNGVQWSLSIQTGLVPGPLSDP